MSRGGGWWGKKYQWEKLKMAVVREKFSDGTKKSETSTDAETVFLAWRGARRSHTGQRKAAGQQRQLLERLGFGEETGHGRV